jgi:UDP-N-acetylmuramoyl-tripeptide--D-alanyl-D-alanine ligase
MKGNHEFDTTDIASPVCGGDRKRGQRPREINAKRNHQHARKRPGNGHTNGVGRGAAGRTTSSHHGFTAANSTVKSGRNSSSDLSSGNGASLGKQATLSEAMEARPLKYITAACAGEQLNGSPEELVQRVCTDSRNIQQGDLFFALPGEKFDGHDFVEQVIRKGAVGVVVRRERAPVSANGCAVIAVQDTRAALGQFAARYRQDFALPIVAIGGSNGKTTTKELVASVLRQRLPVVWSEASFNNDIGVPLTLSKLENWHEAAVLEVGTNHPGELAPLVRMIQPKYGIITSIGREHLEFFGDVEGVAAEEGWLAELLPADGKLFISGDSQWTRRIVERTTATVVRAGFSDANDWRVQLPKVDEGGITFWLQAPKVDYSGEYRINLLGRHQVLNAAYAIAVGAELGLSREEIQRGLAACQAAKMRLQLWELNGVQVLDDSYNANADSMVAALQTLQELPCKGRRIAVLGDMAEQGIHSEAAHEEVGRRVAELEIGQLFAVGKMAPVVARGAREAGMNRIIEFADVETAAAAVKSFLKNGDLVLLKASRSMRLERVGELLRQKNS